MEVKNKNVIVTGGANGIGKEIVKQLLAKKAHVFALDINRSALNALKKEIDDKNLVTYQVDMSSKDSINRFYKKYMKEVGSLDILINNAGIVQPFGKVSELDDDIIERVMNVNFFGPVRLTRLFLNDLTSNKKGGYIVNVSSMGGFFPFPKQSIYGSSKAAIKIFTEGLYAELADTKVGCMVVLPGAINTDILKNSNVTYETTKDAGSYKMTSAYDTAYQIIDGIENNKFKIYIGSDSKFMNFLYKLNSKFAIDFINKKMG